MSDGPALSTPSVDDSAYVFGPGRLGLILIAADSRSERMRHLVADISNLGLGHLSQLGPVLDRISQMAPSIKLIIRTYHDHETVGAFVKSNHYIDKPPIDAEIHTIGPHCYDEVRTSDSFSALHSNWSQIVDLEAARLAVYDPFILVSNISYLSVASAVKFGAPAICLCSVNWLDFIRAYLPHLENKEQILQQIRESYCSANMFLQPMPHMPMQDLPNRVSIGPIARTGLDRRAELRARFGLRPAERIVLVTFGGVPMRSPLLIPQIFNVVWIVQGALLERRPDTIPLSEVNLPFIDVVTSVDLIVGKDSYGVVAESACNGARLLVVPRKGSMETRSLLDWSVKFGSTISFGGQFGDDGFTDAVKRILTNPAQPRVEATGIDQAARLICKEIHQLDRIG